MEVNLQKQDKSSTTANKQYADSNEEGYKTNGNII